MSLFIFNTPDKPEYHELPNNKHFFLFVKASHPDVPKHVATISDFCINSIPE